MRPFNDFELRNQQFLVSKNIKFTLVQITETGLKKNILDATAPMRVYFKENSVHDFELQAQGPENKVLVPSRILTMTECCECQTSFYRPVTKQGDPRLWIYQLTKFTNPDDIHAIIAHDNLLFVINTTQVDIEKCYNSALVNPIKDLVTDIYGLSTSISLELLCIFQKNADTWFKSEVTADTGIGRTIESLLGISQNSDKGPDYKGIELKSMREKKVSKKNVLFTQTPNWNLSKLKSGREIVEKYGYYRDNHKTLENTVSCDHPNSQSLQLNVNPIEQMLEMFSVTDKSRSDVAVWLLETLHNRLAVKHKETFWIEVESVMRGTDEYFRYSKIEHTKNPNIGQFDILLDQSLITLDLMLCRPSGHGDTYSFKIAKKAMPLLFPKSNIYNLR